MNTVNNTSHNTHLYVSQIKPAMYLPKEQYATPEQVNTIENHLYDAKAEQDEVNQSKKQSVWEMAVMEQYAKTQRAAVDAYVTSATGESVSSSSSENKTLSLTETYMNLKAFQEEITPETPSLPEIPSDDVQVQPLNQKAEANAELYQRAQYEKVNSLLHLSA